MQMEFRIESAQGVGWSVGVNLEDGGKAVLDMKVGNDTGRGRWVDLDREEALALSAALKAAADGMR